MKALAADKIISFQTFEKLWCDSYRYREASNKWWSKKESGFYYRNPYGQSKEIIKSFNSFDDGSCIYSEGKKVFYYPHVDITTIDGKVHTKHFKHKTELNTYVENVLQYNVKHILL